MGADFIFAATKMIEDKDEALEKIRTLSHRTLDHVAEFIWGETRPYAEVKDYLRDAVRVGMDEDDRRDTGWMQITEPGKYIITGGMSWGDNPTEACQPLWALDEAGIT